MNPLILVNRRFEHLLKSRYWHIQGCSSIAPRALTSTHNATDHFTPWYFPPRKSIASLLHLSIFSRCFLVRFSSHGLGQILSELGGSCEASPVSGYIDQMTPSGQESGPGTTEISDRNTLISIIKLHLPVVGTLQWRCLRGLGARCGDLTNEMNAVMMRHCPYMQRASTKSK